MEAPDNDTHPHMSENTVVNESHGDHLCHGWYTGPASL